MQKSESIKEIATALSKFQAEIQNPKNTADNPFFKSKYAPLNEILNDVRPLLAKHGLSVLQMPSGDGEELIITTLLMHNSGEYIETCPLKMKPAKNDPQGIGSAVTYGRRYSLSAILGISSEDDDDGNAATHGRPEPTQKPPQAPQSSDKPKGNTTQPATQKLNDAQLKRLFAKQKSNNVPAELVKAEIAKLGKESSKDLSKAEYDKICDFCDNYKPAPAEIAPTGIELSDEDWAQLEAEADALFKEVK